MARVRTTTECHICHRTISKNALGLNAHMRFHERRGEVWQDTEYDAKGNWRTVWYWRGMKLKAI